MFSRVVDCFGFLVYKCNVRHRCVGHVVESHPKGKYCEEDAGRCDRSGSYYGEFAIFVYEGQSLKNVAIYYHDIILSLATMDHNSIPRIGSITHYDRIC